ncbi:MAG: hypothetical protein ABIF10_01760 [Candidatus Woesearchaeota archaeon]
MRCEIRVVDSLQEYNKDIHEKIRKGIVKPISGIVMTPETFSKVFSPERIKLLQRINRNEVKSIYHLAKGLGKPYEVVFRNVKYLEGIGLIRFAAKGRRKVPKIVGALSIDMLNSEGISA